MYFIEERTVRWCCCNNINKIKLLVQEISRKIMVNIFIVIIYTPNKQILDIGILVVLSFIILTESCIFNINILLQVLWSLSIIGLTIIFDEHLKRLCTTWYVRYLDVYMVRRFGLSILCLKQILLWIWLFILAFNKSFCIKTLMETGRYIAYNKPKEYLLQVSKIIGWPHLKYLIVFDVLLYI